MYVKYALIMNDNGSWQACICKDKHLHGLHLFFSMGVGICWDAKCDDDDDGGGDDDDDDDDDVEVIFNLRHSSS